jgi:hypothetical protein
MELSQFKTVEQLAAAIKTLDMVTAVPWTDYAGTSTVDGWSAYTTKIINYKKIVGKLVFVQFAIVGTSDEDFVTFTLPYTSANTGTITTGSGFGVNNGSALTTPIRINLNPNTDTVQCYKDMAAAVWTASGNKQVRGQFWYGIA